MQRPLKKLFEVITGKADLCPLETQPLDILLDRTNKFVAFLLRIGVVKAQVALPAKLLRNTEIETDRLRMTDLQIAVRFGRETGLYTSVVLARSHIGGDYLTNEIGGFGFGI